MYTHGSESYFIEGEGLVSTSGAGRPATEEDAVADPAAAASARSTADAADVPRFRFSRMGPKGAPLSERNLGKIARAMIATGGQTSTAKGIPAGYTYLGQFIDHDLTFDKTLVTLGEFVSPRALKQGRSPALDLDSLYGNGPLDERSQKFYEDDLVHLRMGETVAAPPDRAREGFDLPRGRGRGAVAKRRAVIPDPRNDENLAVAQTHLAMIRFHNRVVDRLPASVPASARFERARRRVVKHYQWMIRHDYLPRICQKRVVDDVFTNGRKVFEVGASPDEFPTMPVEFSVAAFRMGHSMVRATYDWNRRFPGQDGSLGLLFFFSGLGGELGFNPRLPSNWICDFRRLYPFEEYDRPDLAPPDSINTAMRIDTKLVNPLEGLPDSTFGGFDEGEGALQFNLAFRNLVRARMLRLASGQQMAQRLSDAGVPVTPLTAQQILEGSRGAQLDELTSDEKDNLVERTPLWFYVLREAELNRGKLTGVGARIVAETFHRAIEGSETSILRDTGFTPNAGKVDGRFDMPDLLLFAFEGKKTLLNPLGG